MSPRHSMWRCAFGDHAGRRLWRNGSRWSRWRLTARCGRLHDGFWPRLQTHCGPSMCGVEPAHGLQQSVVEARSLCSCWLSSVRLWSVPWRLAEMSHHHRRIVFWLSQPMVSLMAPAAYLHWCWRKHLSGGLAALICALKAHELEC